ncbi:aldo/keto reductase [Natronobacterium gregoryi]|uniref:Aldo/keto reductase n=2 Tax=Natronobacterium gregoryi TaxID=44930 RepID=L0ADS4_NATGS|nr:aldo/keto reductase [Natronobacterium gregoryi]AFZ71579.1 aldo/keto reductase, diketogulonate reductase [Natronobacterium gregoryi SP2]ELY66636.1 aldo/keto reductase [Natronobacterium gregoryi SP2]PLK21348.1 aldo/keto reductase [Natronobacterium gregoryi SP2]SFI81273.1 2,5-diketo-D-gluconate reductase B [Natronobacterium gregoryi]
MTTTEIPQPGFGTSGHEGETCTESVIEALETGYRHVDTAQMYDNEREVGRALADADVDREDVFLATKVHPSNLASDDVLETTEESLERLGVDQVDLLYVHWPMNAYDPEETLPAFDEVRDRGWTRHVGVSNFTVDLLEEAVDVLESPIAAHQVELHPRLQQDELVSVGLEHDIETVAYCPIAQGDVTAVETLQEIADDHDTTPVQIALAWHYDRDGVVPIPKATGDHVRENYAALEIDLTAGERERIADLDRGERLIDPDEAAWNR